MRLNLKLGRHPILITHEVPADVLERLDRFFEIELYEGKAPPPRDKLLTRLHEKAGVITTDRDTIDQDMIPALRSLKVVCNMAEHCDNLDVPALTHAGIMVTTAPVPPGESVREARARRAAENLIAAFGFGRMGGKPADLVNPELLCNCC